MASDLEYWTKYDWLNGHALFTPVRRRLVEPRHHAASQQASRSEEAVVGEPNSKSESGTMSENSPSRGWEDATSFGLTFNNSDCSRSWSFDPSPVTAPTPAPANSPDASVHSRMSPAVIHDAGQPSCGIGLVLGQTGDEACEVEGLIEGASAHACGLIRPGDTLLSVGKNCSRKAPAACSRALVSRFFCRSHIHHDCPFDDSKTAHVSTILVACWTSPWAPP